MEAVVPGHLPEHVLPSAPLRVLEALLLLPPYALHFCFSPFLPSLSLSLCVFCRLFTVRQSGRPEAAQEERHL
jgi:hypothetical protein